MNGRCSNESIQVKTGRIQNAIHDANRLEITDTAVDGRCNGPTCSSKRIAFAPASTSTDEHILGHGGRYTHGPRDLRDISSRRTAGVICGGISMSWFAPFSIYFFPVSICWLSFLCSFYYKARRQKGNCCSSQLHYDSALSYLIYEPGSWVVV
jgi:hypothetical protein